MVATVVASSSFQQENKQKMDSLRTSSRIQESYTLYTMESIRCILYNVYQYVTWNKNGEEGLLTLRHADDQSLSPDIL